MISAGKTLPFLVFAAIVALAAALRVAGLGFGLPDLFHQDEPILVNHAMAIGAGGWNPHFFILPPFCMYALFVLYAIGFAALKLAGAVGDPAAYAALFLTDPSGFYWTARLFLGVCFGTAAVWLVGRRTECLFSKQPALLASLFLALMPLHVRHSHYAYTDVAVTFALTLYWFELLRLARGEGAASAYARAGAVLGWAVSIKYTAAYAAPVFIAAWIAREGGGAFRRRGITSAAVFAATALGTFALLAPYTFLDWSEFWRQIRQQAGAESPLPFWHHLRYSLAGGAGPAFLLLAAAGMAAMFLFHKKEAWITGAFVALFYTVNSCFGQPYARYVLPLTPVLCVLAALGIQTFFGRGLKRPVLAVLLVLLFMVPVTLQSHRLFLKSDTRTLCRQWFEENVPESTVILSSRTFGPRLRQNADQIAEKSKALGSGPKENLKRMRFELERRNLGSKIAYRVYMLSDPERTGTPFSSEQPQIAPSAEAVRALGPAYLVIDRSQASPVVDRMLANLASGLEKVKVFTPYRDPARRHNTDPYGMTAAPDAPGELLARRRLGPYLEVYRLTGEAA